MTISAPLAYLFGAGIALLILERVFTFIKWILRRSNNSKEEHLIGNPYSLSDRQILESLLTKTETTTAAMGALAVDMGIVKTKVEFLTESQKKQNGSVSEFRKTYEKQVRTHDKRIKDLEIGKKRYG